VFSRNTLFYGDNLDWLRERHRFPDACVDLTYLDPPFNSNRNYNVLFRDRTGSESSAQIRAFDDTWEWGPEAEETFVDLTERGFAPGVVPEAMIALRHLLGTNDLLAYLVMMTARLVELHRVLKPTGSLYLHCDPTASHYLKIILDAIFGKENLRNEIIWQRTPSKGLASQRFARNHDVILSFGKSRSTTWNEDATFTAYDHAALDEKTSLKYRYRDEEGRIYRLSDLTNPNPNRPNLTYEFMGVTKVWRWTKERMQAALDAGLIV
jgi:adenine specific DNA methylase Mod